MTDGGEIKYYKGNAVEIMRLHIRESLLSLQTIIKTVSDDTQLKNDKKLKLLIDDAQEGIKYLTEFYQHFDLLEVNKHCFTRITAEHIHLSIDEIIDLHNSLGIENCCCNVEEDETEKIKGDLDASGLDIKRVECTHSDQSREDRKN